MIITTMKRIPSKKIVEKAAEKILILSSPHDTYKIIRLLDLSQPVKNFMNKAYIVRENELISDVKKGLATARTAVAVDEEGKLIGILTRSDLMGNPHKKVVLVDHNEFTQGPKSVEEADIVAVVDHHRLSGDIESYTPILFIVEPLGSASSILWGMYGSYGVYPTKKSAEALLYAILSDTLLLSSPTTSILTKK